ncbi:MAG: PilZ domain-containing protein [SAR324 cluster bacterium]|nr:PilZ domain-containing protein [SAR324 cluster bacterium]
MTTKEGNSSQEEIPREYQRTSLNKTVKVRHKNEQFSTLLKDVSLGGVCLNWPVEQNEDDQLTVFFSTDLYFEGSVRWCQSFESHYEIGVQFPDLDQIAAIYFGEYIEQLEENGSDLLAK